MPNSANPVARLRDLLKRIDKGDAPLRDALPGVLSIDDQDDRAVVVALMAVRALIDEAELAIGRAVDEDEVKAYSGYFPSLRGMFTVRRLSESMRSVSSVLTDDVMTRLELASIRVQKFWSEDDITEELGKFKEAIEQLIGSLQENTAIPADLRSVLTRKLLDILHAINIYRVCGATGVLDAAGNAIGTLATHRAELIEWWDQSDVKRYVEIAQGVAILSAAAHHVGPPALDWLQAGAKLIAG